MRGAVYHYDEDQDYGYINGIDGKRYIFARSDLGHGAALVRGTLVEFQPDDGTAHNIVAAASTTSSSRTGQSARPRRPAENQPIGSPGLWAYFRRAASANYSNFNGRAPRKEFWAFCLCSTIVMLLLFGFGMLVDLAINGFGDGPVRLAIGSVLVLIFLIAMIWPWIALTVRRVHDAGFSGWLAVLCFVPVIGGIAFLIFGLLPSQVGENPWGSVPAGVKV